MKNETMNTEPEPVAQLRALLNVQNRNEALRRSREAEREELQGKILLLQKDPDRLEQEIASLAGADALLKFTDEALSGSQKIANSIAPKVCDLISGFTNRIRELSAASMEAARARAETDLQPYFSPDNLPAAVRLAKVYQDEARFASNHTGDRPHGLGVDFYGGGDAPTRCEVRSIHALLTAYEHARDTLAQVEKHSAELARALR